MRWAWRTRILVHLGIDLRMRLWQAAEDEAVRVFADQPARPAARRARPAPAPRWAWTRASAPASRSPWSTPPARWSPPTRSTRTSRAGSGTSRIATLARLARAHDVELIAIGNGTASRETDKLAGDLIKRHPELKLTKVVVSEAGASVYSASAYASQELPGLDVSLRGAVSIARRLQDPLAELVKIDPKSIGVGQYQHDLSEVKLSRSLDAVVEDCVNAVGVDVNTASAPLLTRVSGIGAGLAENIVAHRDANGPFRTRTALKEVPRLGPEGVRAVRRLPAHPRRRRPARRLQRAPRGVPGGAADPRQPPGSDLRDADRQQRRSCAGCRPTDFVDDTFGLPTVTDILARAGEAGPRPAAGVQDRHLRRGRREDRRPDARAWCWRAWSPTWPRSARSSTSACTRTAWCTSRRCRTPSSRTRATW